MPRKAQTASRVLKALPPIESAGDRSGPLGSSAPDAFRSSAERQASSGSVQKLSRSRSPEQEANQTARSRSHSAGSDHSLGGGRSRSPVKGHGEEVGQNNSRKDPLTLHLPPPPSSSLLLRSGSYKPVAAWLSRTVAKGHRVISGPNDCHIESADGKRAQIQEENKDYVIDEDLHLGDEDLSSSKEFTAGKSTSSKGRGRGRGVGSTARQREPTSEEIRELLTKVHAISEKLG